MLIIPVRKKEQMEIITVINHLNTTMVKFNSVKKQL